MENNYKIYEGDTVELELLTSRLLIGEPSPSFLESLFNRPKGSWNTVDSLCYEVENYEHLREPTSSLDLAVVWLPMPESIENDPYAVVLFYCVELTWSTFAVFNRATLP